MDEPSEDVTIDITESQGVTPDETVAPRVFLAQSAVAEMNAHAAEEAQHEIGGIMVGTVIDGAAPVVLVENIIRGTHMSHARGSVTFTHDAWDDINRIKDEQFADKRIVGWYHSHPGFGLFLSGHDLFIQRNFFTAPWQIAYVTDPQAGTWGCFTWRHNELAQDDQVAVYDAAAAMAARTQEEAKRDKQAAVALAADQLLAHSQSSAWSPALPCSPTGRGETGLMWALWFLAGLVALVAAVAVSNFYELSQLHELQNGSAQRLQTMEQRLQTVGNEVAETRRLLQGTKTEAPARPPGAGGIIGSASGGVAGGGSSQPPTKAGESSGAGGNAPPVGSGSGGSATPPGS